MKITTENIWNTFNNELLRFIKKRVKDNDAAKDLLQDIFIKIHLKLATLTETEKLTSWVYQITRNSILDYYKKHKHSHGPLVDIYDIEDPITYNEDFGKCLTPFINKLPKTYREAILETEVGQLSQKAFAEKANISYSGAKSRIQRGRKQLFEIFNHCCQFSADKYGNVLDYTRKKNCTDC